MTEGTAPIHPLRRSWKRFRKQRLTRWCLRWLGFVAVLALLAPLIANEQPLYFEWRGQSLFPAFSSTPRYILTDPNTGEELIIVTNSANWEQLEQDAIWRCPIPYSPGVADRNNRYLNARHKGPFSAQWQALDNGEKRSISWRKRHWLGTTWDGADVLAGLLHGARVSLGVGLLSMIIAGLLGLILGGMAGFFGDSGLRFSRLQLYLLIPGLWLAFFYGVQVRGPLLVDSIGEGVGSLLLALVISLIIFGGVLFAFWWVGGWLAKRLKWQKTAQLPTDTLVIKTIELFNAVPRLVLILSIAALAGAPSFWYLILIIGCTSWTGVARLTRAEMLRVRTMDFVQAGRALGFSGWRVFLRHALPNGLAPGSAALVFIMTAAILAESALSFLGVGVPSDVVTWGKMLFEGRSNLQAWWLTVLPGVILFLTLLALNFVGEAWREAQTPAATGPSN